MPEPWRSAEVAFACAAQVAGDWAWRLTTISWRLPLQVTKMIAFLSRLALYVLLLLPALLSVAAYWAGVGKNIISVRYKKGGGLRHSCDVWLPVAAANALAKGETPEPTAPVAVIIAGGAFVIGHKGFVSMMCRALRCAGFVCISVDYRYWPQVSMDGMVEDNDLAIGWAVQNCAQYGGDRKRVIVVGHSSGATIGSLLLARRASSDLTAAAAAKTAFGASGGAGTAGAGSKPQQRPQERQPQQREEGDAASSSSWTCSDIFGFVGLGGIYHLHDAFMDHLHGKGIDYTIQRRVFGETKLLREDRSPSVLVRAQPAVADRLPPVLLIHGTSDKIVPHEQSETFRATLLAAGASDVRVVLREGEGHNDPVIHGPLMSDHGIVRDVILNVRRWRCLSGDADDGSPRAAEVREAAAAASEDWESTLAAAFWEELKALPSFPRLPRSLIDLARHITPF
mmetsp:Transcript_12116/g.33029  ORF Transcript_12116/g.33029 Transcript_12116/m.33029 type:complete len:454 (-) Transcript_12116:84-1445(-)